MRDIDKVIGALRSPTRREILGLIWSEELRAGDIAAAFDLTKPTISQHLSVLRDAGLVKMTGVKFVHFGNLNIGGTIAASVQPAINNGNSNAEYFLNSLTPMEPSIIALVSGPLLVATR